MLLSLRLSHLLMLLIFLPATEAIKMRKRIQLKQERPPAQHLNKEPYYFDAVTGVAALLCALVLLLLTVVLSRGAGGSTKGKTHDNVGASKKTTTVSVPPVLPTPSASLVQPPQVTPTATTASPPPSSPSKVHVQLPSSAKKRLRLAAAVVVAAAPARGETRANEMHARAMRRGRLDTMPFAQQGTSSSSPMSPKSGDGVKLPRGQSSSILGASPDAWTTSLRPSPQNSPRWR